MKCKGNFYEYTNTFDTTEHDDNSGQKQQQEEELFT